MNIEVKHQVGDLVRFRPDQEYHLEWLESEEGQITMMMVAVVNETRDTIELDFLHKDAGWYECGESWEHWQFEKVQ